jgi:hypothetical protein
MKSFSISIFVILLNQFFCLRLIDSCSGILVLHKSCLSEKNVSYADQQSNYNCTNEPLSSLEDIGDDLHIRKFLSYSAPLFFLQFQSVLPNFLNKVVFFFCVSTKKIVILQSVLRI